jgi:glycosyltransferase involved in cell wall biosynthesis
MKHPNSNAQKQMKPLISVIMPVYNSEAFLAEAIESILSQTINDFEFLIVYDDSRDRSLSIIKDYQKIDTRIRIIMGEKKALIGALNQGLSNAQGKYIARMDADDISNPERFEQQIQLMESADADICGCHWLVINETGKVKDAYIAPLCRDTMTIYLACTVPFAHGSVMIRNEFIQKYSIRYGGVRYAEDYNLWIILWEKGAIFANVNQFLYQYRESNASLFKKVSKENAADSKWLRRQFVRHNTESCIDAIQALVKSYSNLSTRERIFLLLSSYIVSITTKKPICFNVISRSDLKSIVMALFSLLKGF